MCSITCPQNIFRRSLRGYLVRYRCAIPNHPKGIPRLILLPKKQVSQFPWATCSAVLSYSTLDPYIKLHEKNWNAGWSHTALYGLTKRHKVRQGLFVGQLDIASIIFVPSPSTQGTNTLLEEL